MPPRPGRPQRTPNPQKRSASPKPRGPSDQSLRHLPLGPPAAAQGVHSLCTVLTGAAPPRGVLGLLLKCDNPTAATARARRCLGPSQSSLVLIPAHPTYSGEGKDGTTGEGRGGEGTSCNPPHPLPTCARGPPPREAPSLTVHLALTLGQEGVWERSQGSPSSDHGHAPLQPCQPLWVALRTPSLVPPTRLSRGRCPPASARPLTPARAPSWARAPVPHSPGRESGAVPGSRGRSGVGAGQGDSADPHPEL